MEKEFLEAIGEFNKKSILIVGDIGLDKFIYGKVSRVSPEAPVPVVHINKEKVMLGLAGNTANNISSLGGSAYVLSVVGKNETANDSLKNQLEKLNIKSFLVEEENRKTIFKTRLIGENQQIARIDYENVKDIEKNTENSIIEKVKELIGSIDVIIISDYGKGVITKDLSQEIIKLGNEKNKKVIVDPKPQHKNRYKGAFLITPNEKESFEMTNIKNIEERGKKLNEDLSSNVLLTLGSKGMALFEENEKVKKIQTDAKEVFDVSGAGDTVIATIALGLASGLSLNKSMILSNHSAGIVVGKKGTATIKINELKDIFAKENTKLKEIDELSKIIEESKEKGKKIVTTTGFFDLLHFGHIKLLQDAKKQGNVLVLGINSDESVRKLKGPTRPILNQKERSNILSSLDFVDYVCVFNEETPIEFLTKIKPNIHVKGADRKIDEIIERKAVENVGGEVKLIPITESGSTTKIIDKILTSYQQ